MSSTPRRPARPDDRGRVTDGPVTLGEALGTLAGRLGMGTTALVQTVFARWEEVVGPALAAHVRPLRIDGDTLLLAADHPAWATHTRRLASEILRRVALESGVGRPPSRLEVRVRR